MKMLHATFLSLLIAGMAFVDSGSAVRIASALPGSRCLTLQHINVGENRTKDEYVQLTNCITAQKWKSSFYTGERSKVTSGVIAEQINDTDVRYLANRYPGHDGGFVMVGPPRPSWEWPGPPATVQFRSTHTLYNYWQINGTIGNKNLTADASGYVGPIRQWIGFYDCYV